MDPAALVWEPVDARPLSCLPPLPPADEPSGPPVARENEGTKTKAKYSFTYPVIADDIGRFIRCELVGRLEYPDVDVISSLPVGPVEAAPPKVRACGARDHVWHGA